MTGLTKNHDACLLDRLSKLVVVTGPSVSEVVADLARRRERCLSAFGDVDKGLERERERAMSRVRVLVGTRKGAFILTSDGKRERWDVNGPLFGGWEIFHVKGSPVEPDRLYASKSGGWFGRACDGTRWPWFCRWHSMQGLLRWPSLATQPLARRSTSLRRRCWRR